MVYVSAHSNTQEDDVHLTELMETFEAQFPGLVEQIKNLTAQRLSYLLLMGVGQTGSSGSSTTTLVTLE